MKSALGAVLSGRKKKSTRMRNCETYLNIFLWTRVGFDKWLLIRELSFLRVGSFKNDPSKEARLYPWLLLFKRTPHTHTTNKQVMFEHYNSVDTLNTLVV